MLDPESRARGELLADLYAQHPAEYFEKAVLAQAHILRHNPYRAESYKALRRLYTGAKKGDGAWCLCQALTVLNLAEPDEERFYKRHRADNAAPAQAALTDDDWTTILAHPDLDPLVTRIFALIQPTITRIRTQPLEAMGYDEEVRDPICRSTLTPSPRRSTTPRASSASPRRSCSRTPTTPRGLGFLHAHTPAIVLGRAAFDQQVPTQSMAFVAGRHLSYFRPGYYVRHLVPTGTGLKAWLFAAIKLSAPQFPVAADLEGQVSEAMDAMAVDFQGLQKELLASVVSKLLQSGTTIDLKKWVAAIDMTADRAGFILAHDLTLATEIMNETEDPSGPPAKERMKELVLFGVSAEYLSVREKPLHCHRRVSACVAPRRCRPPSASPSWPASGSARARARRTSARPSPREAPALASSSPPAAGALDAATADRPVPVKRDDWNVLLITIDCLRADMPWAGYARPIAPHLTPELAARSVLYTRAYSLSSYTSMSLGGLLGGELPGELRRDGYFFGTYGKENVLFPEVLQAAGVHTLAAHAHGYFHDAGFDQGAFDCWEVSVPNLKWNNTTDENITSPALEGHRAEKLLSEPRTSEGRFFAWFHFLDPHDQYLPHAGIGPYGNTPRDRYDAEVTFTDVYIGKLLDFVAAQPWGARTAIVVTADHGEAFGEHHQYVARPRASWENLSCGCRSSSSLPLAWRRAPIERAA